MFQSNRKIISEKPQEFDFSSYVSMEDLLDKLKLLNYEEKFLNEIKIKPLHRFYFTITKNPGEQFYFFVLLAWWLIQLSGGHMDKPEESDDPNETIEKILTIVKENGANVDFSANKLKQGIGEHVVYILNHLADEALNKNNFSWKKPKLPEEKEQVTEIIDDESEIHLDRVEEEMMTTYTDDSDEENLFNLGRAPINKNQFSNELSSTTIVDEEAWKLELERILPQIKVTIRNENRDWRTHLEQMKQYQQSIDSNFGPAKVQLEKLYKEISVTLDKIGNREKYLNRELENTLDEYRMLQDQLSKTKDKYKNISGGIAERNRELSKLTDRLETVKQQMEERGSSMTDGTPLVNIKKSVAKIKQEIVDMDVRIGVLECILLQSKVRDEKILENEFGQSISVF